MDKDLYQNLFSSPEGKFYIFSDEKDINEYLNNGFNVRRYSVISKHNNNVEVAIPIDNKKITSSALSELKTFKGRSFKNRLIINLLKIINLLSGSLFSNNKFFIVFDPNNDSILSWLGSSINIDPQNLHFSIYRSSRKYNLPIFNNHGESLGFVRVYNPGENSRKFGENENRVLKKLENLNIKSVSIPKIIRSGYHNDSFVILLSPSGKLRPISRIKKIHISFLKELSKKTGKNMRFEDSLFFKNIKTSLEKLGDFKNILNKSLNNLSGNKMTLSLVQREFPVHHILGKDDGYLVIDWEHAREEYPPVFDLFSLLISAERNISGSYKEKFAKNIKINFFEKHENQISIIKEMLDYYQVSKEDVFYLFILYLFDQVIIANETGTHKTAKRSLNVINLIEKGELSKNNWLPLIK